MKKLYCDRCGAEIIKEIECLDCSGDFPLIFSRARIVKYRYSTKATGEYPFEDYEIDLCLDCTRGLNEWYAERSKDCTEKF